MEPLRDILDKTVLALVGAQMALLLARAITGDAVLNYFIYGLMAVMCAGRGMHTGLFYQPTHEKVHVVLRFLEDGAIGYECQDDKGNKVPKSAETKPLEV